MRRRLLKLTLALMGLLVGLAIAEGGLRMTGRDPIHRVMSFIGTSQWKGECFSLQDDVGYGYTPGACGANEHGFPDGPMKRGEEQPRILLLGDSISADRLFATFKAEEHRPVYGLTTQIESSNPIDVQFSEIRKLGRDLRGDRSWATRMQRLWQPPSWQPTTPANKVLETAEIGS